ncbi:uncharacterized protein LOC127248014 [Andrographis paniculata]|uniref:uncharacterized protein LOC127248014 n=1 Tax=Andrographis paniculata TaxID=175694 RepID=UPI0021E7D244|nr:uncharacterized protein LOC127248014 [Andrographis paniculata]
MFDHPLSTINTRVCKYSPHYNRVFDNLVLMIVSTMRDKTTSNIKWIILVRWFIKFVMLGALFGIFISWMIDRLNFLTLRKNPVDINLNASRDLNRSSKDFYFPSSSFESYLEFPRETAMKKDLNSSTAWISSELEANYSSAIVDKWLASRNKSCKFFKTVDIEVPGLDGIKKIELSSGDIHGFVFRAIDESGEPICSGGDYFETDLSGEIWKARPPINDTGNGTYTFSLQVHPDFPGEYNLTIILLFGNWEGFKPSPEKLSMDKVLRVFRIKFHESASEPPSLRQCCKFDYRKDIWSGRWTRLARNDTCSISDDGRYRCHEPSFPCRNPWCDGRLGALESNGWVYSAHCSFKIFSGDEAWRCLKNRWIFWWGDSNHCDTIRNILHFILGISDMNVVPRMFDRTVANPKNPFETVRFTSVFNGHPNLTGNYHGLNSLTDVKYRRLLKGFFSGLIVPDMVIMNSGLHDGYYWPNITSYVKGSDYAAAFWAEVLKSVEGRGVARPEVVYRTTVATAGPARRLGYNPQKMEAFSGILMDKLKRHGIVDRIVDGFDMTFPWHYDNRCNDGIHYGRAPWKMRWKDGKIGHQYFVDLMLCHVLLNVMCLK